MRYWRFTFIQLEMRAKQNINKMNRIFINIFPFIFGVFLQKLDHFQLPTGVLEMFDELIKMGHITCLLAQVQLNMTMEIVIRNLTTTTIRAFQMDGKFHNPW